MASLVPSAIILTIIVTVIISSEADAAVASERIQFGPNGDYLPDRRSYTGSGSNCCIIPTCDETGSCYQTLSCGYICSHGNHPPAKFGATPGYKLKTSYTKNDCYFGECKNYKFLCTHCQDPNEFDFSIYTVRSDCKECYY